MRAGCFDWTPRPLATEIINYPRRQDVLYEVVSTGGLIAFRHLDNQFTRSLALPENMLHTACTYTIILITS